MSEIIQTPARTPRSRIIVLIAVVLSVLILFLLYGAGLIGLPVLILSNHQNRNCASALKLDKIYTSLYPGFLADATLLGPVQECQAYVSAAAKEEQGIWREAYDAYEAYTSTYPSGLFATEAHQHSAAALLHLVQEQVERESYEEALANLNLILASYSDTPANTGAWNLFPSVYTLWGASLRDEKDFARSEQVLNDFKTWSLTYQQNDSVTEAQRELTQTYLAWGLDLKSQAQFENAITKFELAAAADPESQFGSAEKVKAGQSSAYIDWGNDLLEQDQFPIAIEKFELAVSKSHGTNDERAGDALANGQVRWADQLSAGEDFQGALEHLGFAKEAAVSETMAKSVETALQDTYLTFSKSSGPQARRAMKEVLETICEDQDAPDLQIFGLNPDSIRFAIYGVDEKLPENLTAKTPGEMHYVACVTTDNKTVEKRLHKNIVLQWGRIQYYTFVEQFRVQVIWKVRLLKTDTSESAAEETFKGAPPPPFAETGGNYFYGLPPMEEFTAWLQSVVE
jgi:tetratricopeptide (TPR) repeat protein